MLYVSEKMLLLLFLDVGARVFGAPNLATASCNRLGVVLREG